MTRYALIRFRVIFVYTGGNTARRSCLFTVHKLLGYEFFLPEINVSRNYRRRQIVRERYRFGY